MSGGGGTSRCIRFLYLKVLPHFFKIPKCGLHELLECANETKLVCSCFRASFSQACGNPKHPTFVRGSAAIVVSKNPGKWMSSIAMLASNDRQEAAGDEAEVSSIQRI